MTIPRHAPVRPSDPAAEREQREHELSAALGAIRHAQARVEMLGDRPGMVNVLHRFRDDLAGELIRLDAPPASTTFSPNAPPASGFDTFDARDGGRNDR